MADTKQLFTDTAKTTMVGTLAQGSTTFSVVSAGGNKFPAPTGGNWAEVTLYQLDGSSNEINVEIVKLTSRTGDSFTVERDIYAITGNAGGNAYPGAAGTVYVQLRWTAGGAGNLLQKTMNLGDLPDKPAARTSMGLGNSATKDVGTGSGNVAAGDHTHSTYAAKPSGAAILKGNGSGGFSDATASDVVTLLAANAVQKATSADSATAAGKIDATNWHILEVSGELLFKYGTVIKAKLDSTGNLSVAGNVTAFATL